MSNNLIQLGDLKHFSTCTNHIRTIPEFRHFGQMTKKVVVRGLNMRGLQILKKA